MGISTITAISSDGGLSYKQQLNVEISGNLHEKKSLGIVSEKDKIHANRQLESNTPHTQKNIAPISDPLSKQGHASKPHPPLTKNEQQPPSFVLNQRASSAHINDTTIVSASSHATGLQSVKRPLSKIIPKQHAPRNESYFIDEPSPILPLIYWAIVSE
ncbi:MAG: hypothetical protein ACO3K7_02285 [Candidatus Marinamargulisbacteria bacterium]